MKMRFAKTFVVAVGLSTCVSAANAYEFASAQNKAGILIGASAGVPPVGIYMFNQ